ncbi:uncharacterized protein MONBRDRAFT_9768 [Monosiga brevicollis MX1]|uniref:Uncharacterized protein n=1 Tax=Monosiga brevicollis TaxID=81824 RepID=A9V463_MONBE|nr:uncharacterized protein MONBRDRAFT_9768 [Monosiga brevicollis MX1]EDQ87650.1 predicted protein [Monosiga brevicollis MX1]|eukprot:XP_001747570.1 hypothetical protein [Monosiga brevicollis MX1]
MPWTAVLQNYPDAASAVVALPTYPLFCAAMRLPLRLLHIGAHQKMLGTLAGASVVVVGTGLTALTACLTKYSLLAALGDGPPSMRPAADVILEDAQGLAKILLIAQVFLGTHPRRLCPSHLHHPGAFAQGSLPAGIRYKTASEARLLDRLGHRHGCHTCGTRFQKSFVGDHQPPRSFNLPDMRFFPQCRPCSNSQGGLTSGKVIGVRLMRSHHWSRGFDWHYWGPSAIGLLAAPLFYNSDAVAPTATTVPYLLDPEHYAKLTALGTETARSFGIDPLEAKERVQDRAAEQLSELEEQARAWRDQLIDKGRWPAKTTGQTLRALLKCYLQKVTLFAIMTFYRFLPEAGDRSALDNLELEFKAKSLEIAALWKEL